MKTIIEIAGEVDAVTKVLLDRKKPQGMSHDVFIWFLERFAEIVRAEEREAIYDLVMEAPFKEFDRQEEDFDGEAANAMKAMAFSLTAAIRARSKHGNG